MSTHQMPGISASAQLTQDIHHILSNQFNLGPDTPVTLLDTHKDFEGDITVNLFPLVKITRLSPDELGQTIGQALVQQGNRYRDFNLVKGFLNISYSSAFWGQILQDFETETELGKLRARRKTAEKVMVEFSSPNTNKPLHLGHLRNIFLGEALCRMLEANGFEVIRATLVNDRGVHICKSMLAWMKLGNGETPESSGIKGDHLVGKYYVMYEKMYRSQVQELMDEGMSKENAEKEAPVQGEVQQMLADWEAGKPEIIQVWKMMNAWVYQGFDQTYARLNIQFDKTYYESDTYLLGKSVVEEGLEKKVFFTKENGSVWADLKDFKLDEKLVLRADGTSVYITQDLGTARLKFEEFHISRSVYVIGNEQEHQMKALFAILKMLGEPYAEGLFHLSYGMVELPSGKMKSREGTVVDADDLIREMTDMAREKTEALGKTEGVSDSALLELYDTLGLGALRYYLLKVDPKKGMLFDPEESIDFKGNTGPFIQYSYARIQSLLRKSGKKGFDTFDIHTLQIEAAEAALLQQIIKFVEAVSIDSSKDYDPGKIANYVYELASRFGRFYYEVPVLKVDSEDQLHFRLALCRKTGDIIRQCLWMLGMQVPEKM